MSGGVSRQVAFGGGSCCGGRCCASTAFRCSARGRAAELAAFASLSPLKQTRRVSLRSALRAPTSCLRSSPPQKSPPPKATCRETNHGRRFDKQPTLPDKARRFFFDRHHGLSKGAWALGSALRGRRRGAQGLRPRAQRASPSDSPRLFEWRERSERSEFSGGPRDRAPEGSRCAASTAEAKRTAQRPRAFAAALAARHDHARHNDAPNTDGRGRPQT
jgi:hypothetical protein